jgi:hypothetical protein
VFEDVSFDRALGILQGWAGRAVIVTIDNAGGPSGVAHMTGTLRATTTLTPDGEPLDEDTFEFVLTEAENVGFDLYRGDHFAGASYHAERGELHVAVGEGGCVVVEIRLAVER